MSSLLGDAKTETPWTPDLPDPPEWDVPPWIGVTGGLLALGGLGYLLYYYMTEEED